jgi:hypothetical protein
LLGGASAKARALNFAEDLRQMRLSDGQIRREMHSLNALLNLENVADPESDAAMHFAMIDPSHPVVHDLCHLAEAASETLRHMTEARN